MVFPPKVAPNLCTGELHDVISTAATMQTHDPLHCSHQMSTVPRGQMFYYDGRLDYGFSQCSLVDVEVKAMYPTPVLGIGNSGKVFGFNSPSREHLFSAVELCSGLGGLGMGAQALGFKPYVAIDSNEKMLQLYSAHSGAKVIQGDICDTSTWSKLYKFAPLPLPMFLGFHVSPTVD